MFRAGNDEVQSVFLVACGLHHILSQSILINNTTQFSAVVNMAKNYTVEVNTDYRQQFSKVIKKVGQYLGGL